MLESSNALLAIVDVQEKLLKAMWHQEQLTESTVKLVSGCRVLKMPIIYTEQNPKGLGITIPEIKDLLESNEPVTKVSFSCLGEPVFVQKLNELNRNQVIICGIESHVCVYQTVLDLISSGSDVHVVVDAVSSRTPENRMIGLEKCKDAGAHLTSVETVLFELLKKAEGDQFKQMLKIVK
jgi:nicotinamidase-related amidase